MKTPARTSPRRRHVSLALASILLLLVTAACGAPQTGGEPSAPGHAAETEETAASAHQADTVAPRGPDDPVERSDWERAEQAYAQRVLHLRALADPRSHIWTGHPFPDDDMGWECTGRLNNTPDGLDQGLNFSNEAGAWLSLYLYPSRIVDEAGTPMELEAELEDAILMIIANLFAEGTMPEVVDTQHAHLPDGQELRRVMLSGWGRVRGQEAQELDSMIILVSSGNWRYKVRYTGAAVAPEERAALIESISTFGLRPNDARMGPPRLPGVVEIVDLGLEFRQSCEPDEEALRELRILEGDPTL